MNKGVRKLLACIVGSFMFVLLLAFEMPMETQAGFGDFNDYGSDWSDSDWGGSYDSDWGDSYDSDWGSSYDSDWGSGYSSWSSSSMGNGYNSYSSSAISPITMVIILLTLFVIITRIKQHKPSANTTGYNVVRPQPLKTLPDRTDEISKIIQQKDPAFTAPDFISFAKQVYMDIQDAWEKRDLEPVRAVLHQNLYQQTQRQIEQKIADGIVNYLERISINTAYLTSYRRDAEYEYLTIYLAASMIDYQVREATGEIVYGNKETRWNMYYKMTFMRTAGSTTRSAQEKDEGMMCPNCGAPLQGTSFGKCAYCDSVILTGVYDWVLSGFGVIKNDTVDEGIQV